MRSRSAAEGFGGSLRRLSVARDYTAGESLGVWSAPFPVWMFPILLSLVFAISCGDSFESHYANREAAVVGGAIERGWLPGWMPESATDIDEWHDLDTNHTVASFSYAPADPPVLPSECRVVDPRKSRAWTEGTVPKSRAGSIVLFECPEYGATDRAFVLRVGIDQEKRRVYLERKAA